MTWTNSRNSDVIMSAKASQITSVSSVCSTVCSGADQRKFQSSASLAFVREIHRSPVNSPHKGPVTRKMFPFDDVIMPECAENQQPGRVSRVDKRASTFLGLKKNNYFLHFSFPTVMLTYKYVDYLITIVLNIGMSPYLAPSHYPKPCWPYQLKMDTP